MGEEKSWCGAGAGEKQRVLRCCFVALCGAEATGGHCYFFSILIVILESGIKIKKM